MEFEFCKLEIFIPSTHFDMLQKALQEVDAGHVGAYDGCLSFSEVKGCWRPLKDSNPYDGEIGVLNYGTEYKVEVLCKTVNLDKTISAIKNVHPYEVPVINAIPLLQTGL